LKGIRFKPDAILWILKGKKSTTFRFRRYNGIYTIVYGSWFDPKSLGIEVRLTPIKRIKARDVIEHHWRTEGDFNFKEDFVAWLMAKGMYERFDTDKLGWLHKVELVSP